ncbi:MAG: hypothetical protein HY203_08895 [Nitrospirae bacterium]|nr:hypothetical protein [Nitrospirota bacterium]
MLREHYPNEFVDELQQLLKATTEDLPKARPVVYNPIFGSIVGGVSIGADGDLLIRDLLLELKLSTKGFGSNHLWQLLGYAALDANLGNRRIRRVGLYNSRYRALWIKPVDDLTRELGGTSFKQLYHWFNSTIVKAL